MNFFYYIVLSFIQAITEFLPISSSGNLLFIKGICNITDIPLIFDIIVHVASLCAIVIFYAQRIGDTFKKGILELSTGKKQKNKVRFLVYIIISTTVTFLIYLLFKDFIESKFTTPSVLGYTFFITSIILFSTIFCKNKDKKKIEDGNLIVAIMAGIFQGLAILPGISRSGATISSLLLLRIQRKEAAYYSFFLAIPAILGALIFKLSELENVHFISENLLVLIVSFVICAFFSYIFLKILIFIINKGKFWIFSVYTLILSIVSFVIF